MADQVSDTIRGDCLFTPHAHFQLRLGGVKPRSSPSSMKLCNSICAHHSFWLFFIVSHFWLLNCFHVYVFIITSINNWLEILDILPALILAFSLLTIHPSGVRTVCFYLWTPLWFDFNKCLVLCMPACVHLFINCLTNWFI